MTLKDISWSLFLCGLGLFLFGVVLMGDSLKSLAGDKLRDFIDKYTSKPIQGVLVGAAMSALIQSSSATTAITIGFVRAGLMSLEQAAGIIIGANIGTTITAFLIGLNITGIAPYLIVVGAFMLLFAKKKKTKDIANFLVGFGVLFYGLDLISSTLSELKNVESFTKLAAMCDQNPFIGLGIGIIMTCAMQSSAAAIGTIQIIYASGAMSFQAVLPFLFGSNIGTCITAIMASMGGNVASKRAAFLHTTFNVIGSILGMIFLQPLSSFILSFNLEPMMQIAVAHIIFNIVTAILVFPFINKLCGFTRLVIKGDEPKKRSIDIDNLNPNNIPVPSTALSMVYKAILQEKELVIESVSACRDYYMSRFKDKDKLDDMNSTEDLIDKMDISITRFLTALAGNNLSPESVKIDNLYMETSKNLERIGDVTINIAEFGQMIDNEKGTFTDAALNEINQMFDCFFEMLDITFKYLETKDIQYYGELMKKEETMDLLEETSRDNHFKRMITKECNSPVASSVYADILSNLERMGDHCCNIARKLFYIN